MQALFKTLSTDERQKAEKYRFEKDRRSFIAARGTLRKILGGYLGISPSEIRFFYNRYGKPFLDPKAGRLSFNVSHSGEFALFVIARDRSVGIDIEFIDNNLEILKTAESVFSSAEISIFKSLPANLRTAAFFCGWTRKEAFLKALGKGFSISPKQFTVSIMPEETNISLTTNESLKVRDWSLRSLPFGENYMAAMAVEGKIETVRFWQQPEIS